MSVKLVAITGGIGTGKSVVSHLLSIMDYPVYDTDAGAKRLMASDSDLQRQLRDTFGNEIFMPCGELDRKGLANLVFNDQQALQRLNAIVHPAVINDVLHWRSQLASPVTFVETAILYQSHLDQVVDAVWEVSAPLQVRINRVMARNGSTAEEVLRRIEAQASEELRHSKHDFIINDGLKPLLPQVTRLLQVLK